MVGTQRKDCHTGTHLGTFLYRMENACRIIHHPEGIHRSPEAVLHEPPPQIVGKATAHKEHPLCRPYLKVGLRNISFCSKSHHQNFQSVELSQVSPTRPERAEAPSPGHRPGLLRALAYRPVRAKALKALGNLQSFCPYRAPYRLPSYPGRCPGLGAFGPSART